MKDIALHFKHEKYMNSDYEKFLQGNDKSEEDKEDEYPHQGDFEQPQGDVNKAINSKG
tara:strand:+ start:84 stop:257 length:174 start_codon:yes stop_codon:yes gene_type:complete